MLQQKKRRAKGLECLLLLRLLWHYGRLSLTLASLVILAHSCLSWTYCTSNVVSLNRSDFNHWASVQLIVLQEGVVSPLPNHHSGGPGFMSFPSPVSPYLCPPEAACSSYTPRHWVPNLVASYDTHGVRWGYSNSRPSHGKNITVLLLFLLFFVYSIFKNLLIILYTAIFVLKACMQQLSNSEIFWRAKTLGGGCSPF